MIQVDPENKKMTVDNLKSSFVLCTVPLTKAKLELFLKINIVCIKNSCDTLFAIL